MGLTSLPRPKNDYEIVVPEDEEDHVEMQASATLIFSSIYLVYRFQSSGFVIVFSSTELPYYNHDVDC